MNLNNHFVYRCPWLGPLHQLGPGRSSSLIRYRNRLHRPPPCIVWSLLVFSYGIHLHLFLPTCREVLGSPLRKSSRRLSLGCGSRCSPFCSQSRPASHRVRDHFEKPFPLTAG